MDSATVARWGQTDDPVEAMAIAGRLHTATIAAPTDTALPLRSEHLDATNLITGTVRDLWIPLSFEVQPCYCFKKSYKGTTRGLHCYAHEEGELFG
jgi:hypothetical protein